MVDQTPDLETVRLVYVGRRFDAKAKLGHGWISATDPDDTRLYGKVVGRVVGGIYTVEQQPGTTSVVGGSVAFTGERVDDVDQIAAWEVAHQEALTQDGRRKAEASMARRSELDRALEPLEEVARTLRTRHDIAALQSLVNERLVAAYYTRKK